MTPEQEKALALSRARARRSQAEAASAPVEPTEPESISGDGFGSRAAGNLYKFAKGATLGLGDRLTAATLAGLEDKIDYGEALDEVRKLDKEHSENYPVSSAASEIAGSIPTAIAATPMKFLQAASALGRMGRSALVGTGFGSAAGAASTEDFTDVGQLAADTLQGGTLGGFFGLGAQGVGEFAKKLPAAGRWLGDATGLTDAQKSARKAILRALSEDKQLPEMVISQLRGSSVPLTVSDVSGEGMRQLADAVTTQPGQGSVNARNVLEARRSNRPDRVKNYLSAISPEDDAAKTIDDLLAERSKRARPMYAKALSETITEDNLTPELERLVKNPNIRKGVVHGASIQRNIADAENIPFRPNDYIIDRGRPVTEQDLAMFPQYADDIIGRNFVPDYEPSKDITDEIGRFNDVKSYLTTKQVAPQRQSTHPVLNYLRKTSGGIDPSGRFARELNSLDVNTKTHLNLFKRGGKTDFDNIPATEFMDAFPDITVPADAINNGYIDESFLLDLVRSEKMSPRSSMAASDADMFMGNEIEYLDRLGVNPLTDTEASLRKALTNTEILPDSPIPDAAPLIEKAIPNIRSLHAARVALDDRIEKARNRVTGQLEINNEIGSLIALRSALDDQLKQVSPSLKEADQMFGSITKLKDAVEIGKGLMRGDVDYKSRAVSDMTAPEKAMMRIGAARDLRRTVENTRDNSDVVGIIAGSDDQRNRLRMLFDDQKSYEDFIRKLNKEKGATELEKRLLGGSQTEPRRLNVKDKLGDDVDIPLSKANLIGNVLQAVSAPLRNLGSAARSARAAEIQPVILNTNKEKVIEELLKLTPEALARVASQQRNAYMANVAKTLLTMEEGEY